VSETSVARRSVGWGLARDEAGGLEAVDQAGDVARGDLHRVGQGALRARPPVVQQPDQRRPGHREPVTSQTPGHVLVEEHDDLEEPVQRLTRIM
jgi:hypothetical protein